MSTRPKIPETLVADLLFKSRRRCCLCVFLRNDNSVKKGQIAHLNKNSADNSEDNLAFLCLEHHDEYDTRTSVSKGLTSKEVKGYRDLLYAKNETLGGKGKFTANFEKLRTALGRILDELFPSKATTDSVQGQLLELDLQLLRLQTIIEELGKLSLDEAENLWIIAAREGLAMSDSEIASLALLNRYLSIMSDLASTLKGTIRSMLQVEAPEVADYLTSIWEVKIELYQLLTNEDHNRSVAQQILDKEDWFSCLEATRTLESQALLQVVDREARVVARDFETGLTVFGELHRNREVLIETIDLARRDLRHFIHTQNPFL